MLIHTSYNTKTIIAHGAEVEAEIAIHTQMLNMMPTLREQIEDIKANQMPQGSAHGAQDRARVQEDLRCTLNRFIGVEVSVEPETRGESDPSMQVSTLGRTDPTITNTTKFYTAPVTQASGAPQCMTVRKCTQLFVRNAGNSKTLTFHVRPENSMETIKELVRERVDLPYAQFDFVCSGRVLRDHTQSIEEAGIAHDATLTCVSFRPGHQGAVPTQTHNDNNSFLKRWRDRDSHSASRSNFLDINYETLKHPRKLFESLGLDKAKSYHTPSKKLRGIKPVPTKGKRTSVLSRLAIARTIAEDAPSEEEVREPPVEPYDNKSSLDVEAASLIRHSNGSGTRPCFTETQTPKQEKQYLTTMCLAPVATAISLTLPQMLPTLEAQALFGTPEDLSTKKKIHRFRHSSRQRVNDLVNRLRHLRRGGNLEHSASSPEKEKSVVVMKWLEGVSQPTRVI